MTGRNPALLDRRWGPAAALPWRGAAPRPGGILVLPGDLRKDGLGLDPADAAALAAGIDLVVHCAAATSFQLDDATYRAVNVEGAARVIALAERGGPWPIPVVQVSTAYVCGERSGPVEEVPPRPDARYANGYERSKAEAEGIAAAALDRGVPVAVARPSIVVGAWTDGAIGRYDGLYGMFRLVSEGRLRTVPASPGASLDLVPLDHVIEGLARIAEGMDRAAGRVFHLVSGRPVPVGVLRDLALSYPQFHAPRFVPPEGFDLAALDEEERWWHRHVAGFYASYLRRAPLFRDGNLRALGGPACPPMDWAFLRRMLDRCIRDGYLRGEAEGRRTPTAAGGQPC